MAFASSLNGRVRVCCSAVSLLEFHVLQQGVLISLTQDLHDISVELCYQMAVETGLHQHSELNELKITEQILHGEGPQPNVVCHPWIF